MSKTLIVAPSWIGDAVLSQPLLKRLRERDPQAKIDVLAPPWVAPVYRAMPEVGMILDNPFGHGQLRLLKRRALGKRLAALGYERAYVLPNSAKSALVPFFAGIPQRIGYRGELRRGLLTDVRRLDEQALPLMVERFAALAQSSRESFTRPIANPRLQVDAARVMAVLTKFGADTTDTITVLCPGAEYGPAKRWPTKYFAQCAKALDSAGGRAWLLGSAKDYDLGEEVSAESSGVARNLCGKTSLDEAIAILSAARLVITNDSGLMHVAAAFDRPTIAIFGSSSPGFTPPLSPRARVLSLGVPCSPCFKRDCPLGHFDCMRKLMPERVLQEVATFAR